MADTIENIISVQQLKADYLDTVAQDKDQPLFIRYDTLSDTLMLLFISPYIETTVHHLDQHVAVLFRPDTLDIVGLQVEDFEYSFMPQHENVRRVWRLREANIGIEWPEDFGDIVLMVERMKTQVVREIIRAAQPVLDEIGEAGESLKRAAQESETASIRVS